MPEPVATTLASISLFLQIFDSCDRLYHGYKLNRRFGTDFENVQIELEIQWARFEILVNRQRVRQDEIELSDRNRNQHETVRRGLKLMEGLFGDCNALMKWYDGEGQLMKIFLNKVDNLPENHGPLPRTISTEAQTTSPASSPTTPSISTLAQSDSTRESARKRKKSLVPWKRWTRSTSQSADPASRSSTVISSQPSNVSSQASNSGFLGLDTAELSSTAQRVEQHAELLQGSVAYWRKISWARSDYDELKNTIRRIQTNNNELGKLIKGIALQDAAVNLPAFEAADRFWPVVAQVKEALGTLHNDLMDVNVGSERGDAYHLSIQLLEDNDRSRSDVSGRRGAHHHLHDGSRIFNIQRHGSKDLKDKSKLLLIENVKTSQHMSTPPSWDPESIPCLHNLDRPRDIELPVFSEVEVWGCFPAYSDHASRFEQSGFWNKVYHAKSEEWQRTANLKDILDRSDFHRYILPVQVVQVARLVLDGYLYLESVQTTCVNPRPENYVFYQTPDEGQEWSLDNPLVLRPWLAFGFGRRGPAKKLGGASGITQVPSSAMIELGLILFQLGTGKALDYGIGAQGFRFARSKALSDIDELDSRVGCIYTEIVKGLLEFQTPASHLLAANDETKGTEYVKKAVEALYSLEQKLEGTVTAPLPLIEVTSPLDELVNDELDRLRASS